MGSRADSLNRVLLTILGALLLAAGVTGVLFGTGALGAQYADRRILADGAADYVRDNAAWIWPLVALVALALALLALRWLLQQLRTDRVDAVDLTEYRSRGEVRVQAAALTDALVDAVERSPGVDDASARLISVKGRETLLLHIRLADRADLEATRRGLADGPLAELRQVLGGTDWPDVRVELEPSRKGDGRVVA